LGKNCKKGRTAREEEWHIPRFSEDNQERKIAAIYKEFSGRRVQVIKEYFVSQ